MQLEVLKILLSYAVGQFGYDRFYTIQFGTNTAKELMHSDYLYPVVQVFEDDNKTKLSEVWMSNEVIQQKKFY